MAYLPFVKCSRVAVCIMMSHTPMCTRNFGLSSHCLETSKLISCHFSDSDYLDQKSLHPSRLVMSLCLRSIASFPFLHSFSFFRMLQHHLLTDLYDTAVDLI